MKTKTKKKAFEKVISCTELTGIATPKNYRWSRHMKVDRWRREQKINQIGYGALVCEFEVTRKNEKTNQYELQRHVLTSTGVLFVLSEANLLITMFVATVDRIKSYWLGLGRSAPQWLLGEAKRNDAIDTNHF